jgi:hypothetical protein
MLSVSSLLVALAASAAVSAVLVLLLRMLFGHPDAIALTFKTSSAIERKGWATFWARDPFVQAHRGRKGIAFGTYKVPGGEPIATHFAASDMLQHTLILGATGSGKSSLMEQLALFRLRSGKPFTLIDLHGDLFARVASWALHEGARRSFPLTLIDFTQPDLLPAWNPLTRMDGVDVGRQVDLLVGVLKRLYSAERVSSWSWGVKIEELTRWALRACIESATPMSLVDLKSFFLMPATRKQVLATASEESRAYWTGRFERTKQDEQYVSAVLNKLEPFLGSVAVQRFLGGPRFTFDLLGAIERGETVLVNLAKGYLGPTADVTGRLLMNAFQIAALQRERIASEDRKPYSILLDEAHVLGGQDSGLEDFLIAARKYKVFVTLAAQGLSLFPPSFRPHLLGNTGSQFFFRLPYSEARMLTPDILEPLGSVWREQLRPHDSIDDPLLTPAEEIAWRTSELAHLPTGACYWLLKGRPYKARRIQVLPPAAVGMRSGELRRRLNEAMQAAKNGIPARAVAANGLSSLAAAIAERSARRAQAAGIVDDEAA